MRKLKACLAVGLSVELLFWVGVVGWRQVSRGLAQSCWVIWIYDSPFVCVFHALDSSVPRNIAGVFS